MKSGPSTPISRRQALAGMGVLAAAPVLGAYHPLVPAQEGGWQPRFFDIREADLVAELAECIIPETDTPGARRANVHQYIDLVLHEDATPGTQEAFRRGLGAFEGARGNAPRQIELLRQGGAFFEELKALTIDGYYSSEIGMRQELGFEGRTFVTVFEGCTHEAHQRWTPPKP